MNTFYRGKALKVAWEIFKIRPALFVLFGAIFTLPNLPSLVMPGLSPAPGTPLPSWFPILLFVGFILWLLVSYLMMLFVLRAHDDVRAISLKTFFTQWNRFVPFSLGLILYCIIVVLGTIALIIPGLILAMMFGLSYLFILDKGSKVLESFKQSRAVTKGHRLRIFGLFVAMMAIAIGVNIVVGFVLGILMAILGADPNDSQKFLDVFFTFLGNVTMLVFSMSFVHAYRVLTGTKTPDATVSVAA